ncbi:MAG: PIN domain-containing protein [Gaiellaceae bacterium]
MGRVGGPFGGGVFIADTSAWARSEQGSVAREWQRAVEAGQIATCPVVKLEVLLSARDGAEYDSRDDVLGTLRDVPVTRSVTDAALAALRELAHVRPLHQRGIPLPDLLIAACAQDAGVGVLHYDRHFDRLAEVLDFESRWIVPPGSLD